MVRRRLQRRRRERADRSEDDDVSAVSSTLRACLGPRGRYAGQIQRVLRGTSTYWFSNGRLFIRRIGPQATLTLKLSPQA